MRNSLLIGGVGIVGTLSVPEWAAVIVATATVLSLLPLIYWRWRALLTGQPKKEK